jgi:hypothetical protein
MHNAAFVCLASTGDHNHVLLERHLTSIGCAFSFRKAMSIVVLVFLISCPVGVFRTATGEPSFLHNSIVLNSRAVLIVASDAPLPVRHAVEDLSSDMAKAFGVKPRTATAIEDAGPIAIGDVGRTAAAIVRGAGIEMQRVMRGARGSGQFESARSA